MSNKKTIHKLENLFKYINKIAKDPQLQKVIGKSLLELNKSIYINLKKYKKKELDRQQKKLDKQYIETGYVGYVPQSESNNICSICGGKTSFSESSNKIRKYHNICSECFKDVDIDENERYTPLDFN
jgi:hypothetical protein